VAKGGSGGTCGQTEWSVGDIILYRSMEHSSSITGVISESPFVGIISVVNLQGATGGMNSGSHAVHTYEDSAATPVTPPPGRLNCPSEVATW
jgi:hypothetical protein